MEKVKYICNDFDNVYTIETYREITCAVIGQVWVESANRFEVDQVNFFVTLDEAKAFCGGKSTVTNYILSVDRADKVVEKPIYENQKLIDAVKAHAMDNYEIYENGWAFVIECYTDADLSEVLDTVDCETVDDAIKFMTSIVNARSEY